MVSRISRFILSQVLVEGDGLELKILLFLSFQIAQSVEAREQLPDALENWVVKGDCFPISQSVPYATTIPLGASHSLSSPVPNLLTVMAVVEKVFHGFLTLLAKGASRRASEALLNKVVPGEDAVLSCEPKKKGNLGPEKRLPDFAPDYFGGLVWEIHLKVVSFFDRENT
jgi:hypothetical protein